MHKTKNDLPEPTRKLIADLLNARLADSIDLMMQAKQAHWNVKGPNFIALHELFDMIVDDAEEYMDLVAERAVQLGATAEGTIAVAVRRLFADLPNRAATRAYAEPFGWAETTAGQLTLFRRIAGAG